MPIASILNYLSSGMPINDLLEEFPFLMKDDVKKALAFSARVMQYKYFSLESAF